MALNKLPTLVPLVKEQKVNDKHKQNVTKEGLLWIKLLALAC